VQVRDPRRSSKRQQILDEEYLIMSDPIVETMRRLLVAGAACGFLLATPGLASAQQTQSQSAPSQQQQYRVLNSHVAWISPPETVACPELPDPQPGQSGWHLFQSHMQWYGACAHPLVSSRTLTAGPSSPSDSIWTGPCGQVVCYDWVGDGQ